MPTDDLPGIAARCFRGADGRQLLKYLRDMTLERTLGPGADDATLRHLEGQRQLVQHLTALIDRGRLGPAPQPHDTETDDDEGH